MLADPARRVLVVEDGESRGAVAAVRALARAGWVVGVGSSARGPAGASRSVTWRDDLPRIADGLDAYVTCVARLVEARGYALVFGAGDAEVWALSSARDRLGAVVPYPPHECVVGTLDKARAEASAREAGLPTPAALDPAGLGGLSGPFVVKPLVHGGVGHRGPSRLEARRVPDAEGALRRVREIELAGGSAVVQEVVTGDLLALVVLLDRQGRLVAAVQQRAERLQPPLAGVSARAVTVPVDEELTDRASDFLRRTGWWGLAELQLLAGPGRVPTLIDVNGRFYGSLALSVAAGLNLPDLWARVALGEPTELGLRGRPGAGYQWLEGDLRSALAQRSAGASGSVLDALSCAPRRTHSLLSWTDPGPAAFAAARLAGRGLRKLAARGQAR